MTRFDAGVRRARQRLRRFFKPRADPTKPPVEVPSQAAPPAATDVVPGTRLVGVDGRSVIAHLTTTFRASTVLAEHASLIADAFEAAEVDYFVLRAPVQSRRVLVVVEDRRGQAFEALVSALTGTATYLRPAVGARARRPELLERHPSGEEASWRVFRYRVAPNGRVLSGPELACEVQFWRRITEVSPLVSREQVDGSLLGPRSSEPVPDLISPESQDLELRPVDGHPRPQLACLRTHICST